MSGRLRYSFYPGCSLSGTGREFKESTEAVCRALGVELVELENWTCCGASPAHNTDRLLAAALPAKDLATAAREGMDLVVVCAACFNRLKMAQHELATNSEIREKVASVIDISGIEGVHVRHLMDVVVNDVGLDSVKNGVTRPLEGLKAAAYYGCLLVRPPDIMGFDDPEHPMLMDEIIAALGAEPVRWSYKVECCGGSLSIPRADLSRKLVSNLIRRAGEAGAQCTVTACPLCQSNLEMRRESGQKMPSFFFTELMGMAMGLDEVTSWLKRHLVDPMPLVSELGLLNWR